jgi:hypothetical protein
LQLKKTPTRQNEGYSWSNIREIKQINICFLFFVFIYTNLIKHRPPKKLNKYVFLFEESKKNGRIYVKFNSVFIDAVKEQAQILKTFITQHPLGMIFFLFPLFFFCSSLCVSCWTRSDWTEKVCSCWSDSVDHCKRVEMCLFFFFCAG